MCAERAGRDPRRVLAAAVLAAAAALGGGCSAGPPAGVAHAGASSAGPAPSADPAVARACGDARKVINDSTARFTAQLDQAVSAGDRGDATAQAAAIGDLRRTFADWAAALRAQAGHMPDARLAAALTEYAGAVDATIARVRTAGDLETLTTFDDRELDLMANQLAHVCG